ncbi:MAG: hypothetical protein AAGG38_04200 [Planctomycetota bacterium]
MSVETKALRDVVAGSIDRQWLAWSAEHPHLARAIDRTRLVNEAVDRLEDDEGFRAALRAADLDERRLVEAAEVLAVAEGWVRRALRW